MSKKNCPECIFNEDANVQKLVFDNLELELLRQDGPTDRAGTRTGWYLA